MSVGIALTVSSERRIQVRMTSEADLSSSKADLLNQSAIASSHLKVMVTSFAISLSFIPAPVFPIQRKRIKPSVLSPDLSKDWLRGSRSSKEVKMTQSTKYETEAFFCPELNKKVIISRTRYVMRSTRTATRQKIIDDIIRIECSDDHLCRFSMGRSTCPFKEILIRKGKE